MKIKCTQYTQFIAASHKSSVSVLVYFKLYFFVLLFSSFLVKCFRKKDNRVNCPFTLLQANVDFSIAKMKSTLSFD